jgi:hypothetical protein
VRKREGSTSRARAVRFGWGERRDSRWVERDVDCAIFAVMRFL